MQFIFIFTGLSRSFFFFFFSSRRRHTRFDCDWSSDVCSSDLGLMRVEALPRGDPNNNDNLRKFADAVLVAEPTAIGGPVSILKSGDTVVKAFIHAGIYALVVIGLLLWVTLRRITDVLLTLVPLLVAGAVTMEICVLIGLPLNFANIVALP